MILRFALLLALGALVSFLFTDGLEVLGLPSVANYAAQLGSVSLLVAFVLLLSAGTLLFVKLAAVSFWRYFSEHRRLSRRLAFYVNRHEQISRQYYFKKMRLLHLNHQKIKNMSGRPNKDVAAHDVHGDYSSNP
jgi:hypothetical protein